jgi:hypothetical protein
MKEGPGAADEPEDRQIASDFIQQVLERHRA